MKRSNKGFSYLELVVVMAVMAIMATIITISIGTANRNEVFRTSERLQTMVNKARINAMAKGSANPYSDTDKGNGWLNIAKSGGSYYASVGKLDDDPASVKKNGEKIGNGKMNIYVVSEDEDHQVTDTKVRHLAFKQSTGGVPGGYGGVSFSFYVTYKDTRSHFEVNSVTGKIEP